MRLVLLFLIISTEIGWATYSGPLQFSYLNVNIGTVYIKLGAFNAHRHCSHTARLSNLCYDLLFWIIQKFVLLLKIVKFYWQDILITKMWYQVVSDYHTPDLLRHWDQLPYIMETFRTQRVNTFLFVIVTL